MKLTASAPSAPLSDSIRQNLPFSALPPELRTSVLRMQGILKDSHLKKNDIIPGMIDDMIATGMYEKAFGLCYAYVMKGFGGEAGLFYIAALLYELGHKHIATVLFAQIYEDPHIVSDIRPFKPSIGKVFFESLARYNERLANTLRPTAFLGPYDGPNDAEYRIGRMLEQAFKEYEAGIIRAPEGPQPPHEQGELPLESPRVLLVMLEYYESDDTALPFVPTVNFLEAAQGQPLTIKLFCGDFILHGAHPVVQGERTFRTPERTRQQVQELEKCIQEFQPHLMVLEIGFVPYGLSILPAEVDNLRQTYGFKVVGYLSDDNFNNDSFYFSWSNVCDKMMVCCHHNSYAHLSLHDRSKAFAQIPISKEFYNMTIPEKDIDVLFFASLHRLRNVYMNAFQCGGVNTVVKASGRESDCRYTNAQYADFFARSKISFANGRYHHGSNVDIMVGRSFECTLSHTLLLQEDGNPICDYFLPYIHYIPVGNVHDAVHFSRFFLKHEDWRQRITQGAYEWHKKNYPPEKLWENILYAVFRPDLCPPMKHREF